jgi:hypothetical protein
VLGDSDSHAYHDSIRLSPSARGGVAYDPHTLQWTEILARLRSAEVDLGEWGTWGTRHRYAILHRLVGRAGRAPAKMDFRYSMALSGATCADLTTGRGRQVQPLADIIGANAARWSRGVVVVRIGINSIGNTALDRHARNGLDAEARSAVAD